MTAQDQQLVEAYDTAENRAIVLREMLTAGIITPDEERKLQKYESYLLEHLAEYCRIKRGE